MKGLELSKQFYLEIGKPMLEKLYPTYVNKIAVGLVGMGSECLGFDDQISSDHDFGPGFCLWLTKDDYQQVGAALTKSYNELPLEFLGYTREVSNHGNGRVGVFEIEAFYQQFIGKIPTSNIEWLYLNESYLACATNGEVFVDCLGEFTKIRESLRSYPNDVRIKKIVARIAIMAQSGQYNYARCMQRKEYVAASLAIGRFIESTISCVYLLNNQYMPFYKWMHHGIKDLKQLSMVSKYLEELVLLPNQDEQWEQGSDFYLTHLNIKDEKVKLIEKICALIVTELNIAGLSNSTKPFLENHTMLVMEKIVDQTIYRRHIMEG